MRFHCPLNDRKSESRPFDGLGMVCFHPVKPFENIFQRCIGNADTIVDHFDNESVSLLFSGDIDLDFYAGLGILLQCVFD